MLEVVSCSSPEEKRRLFEEFDPNGRTWVVSDLQSKWQLQKELLARDGRLEQTCVMRATELWRQLSFQAQPDVRLLSPELAQTLFWNWIQPMRLPWAKSPHAVPVVLNQMQMWMTILSDPKADEIMSQWFAENQDSFVRWGHWFELCSKIWHRCRQERVMMVSWLPALLLGSDLHELEWDRRLTFDLGPQVSQVEGVLVKELANVFDVTLIFPEAPWLGLMQNTLKPYELILPEPYRGDPEWQPNVADTFSFGRFSTQLAEVKDAVGRIRQWLDAGIEPQKIALVAPDIEAYWPAVRLYLDQEGIPACKPVTARLGSFLEMAQWAAGLRTALKTISSGDLEVFLFANDGEPRLSFDEFRVLFTNVYDDFDLARARHLFESMEAPNPDEALPVADFLAWALRSWNAERDPARLSEFMQTVGQEVPVDLELLPSQWLGYIEGVLARREINVRGADEKGVWCVSLSSADWLPATHGIFVDLSEGALRSFQNMPVSDGEGQKIFTDTGWAVGTNDRQEHEFEFLWFLNRAWTDLRLTFAASDFEGRVLTPSRLWMWAAFSNEQLKRTAEIPETTRWDEIQHASLDRLARARDLSPARVRALETGLARDLSIEISSWEPSPRVRISASSLGDYWTCPFIYAAGRKLGLSNDPALDLDLDRFGRGRLLHGIAQALGEEPFRHDHDDDALTKVIEAARAQDEILLGDERMWPVILAQHARLARMFLEHERDWRLRFPTTYTSGREVEFRCGWDVATGKPTCEVGDVTLSGRMDRVDRDGRGRLALVDYKGSDIGKNWKTWVNNGDVQMPLYASLLEDGLGGHEAGEVVAANFYVIKGRDRRKGYHLRADQSDLYDVTFKHQNFITAEEKQQLFADVRARINEAVVQMQGGRFNPEPLERKTCDSCHWRTLCRAPHLN